MDELEETGVATKRGNSWGSTIGVFFLSWLVWAVGANIVVTICWGTFGVGGSLVGSLIIAGLWKRGSFAANGGMGGVVLVSLLLGIVAGVIVVAALPTLYQMRYGG